ncbi:hypothetical protein NLU13_7474 [Sarocladium strictum]|uniref:Uncharacterized protein n=1 Tax=Sarocladium strictum TaxID=5046 RepID=A0AA39GD65_SARSR|nr:hypothetical protein NLU13_7474 [Sarocladium strictum]
MANQESHQFLYKIIPGPPPEPIPAQYPLSDLDKHSGFVHLSKASQVPGTGDLFFTEASDLWVLKLVAGKFEKNTKWEDGFPHLYGNFGHDEVDSVERFQRPSGKKWSEVMAGSKWLI